MASRTALTIALLLLAAPLATFAQGVAPSPASRRPSVAAPSPAGRSPSVAPSPTTRVAAAPGPTAGSPNGTTGSCQTLAQLLDSTPDLSTTAALLEENELFPILNNKTARFTFFLPTNDAWQASADDITANLNNDTLLVLLAGHVVGGLHFVKNVTADSPLVLTPLVNTTACAGQLTVTHDGDAFNVSSASTDNTATITQQDIRVCSGVVNIIDDILVACDALEKEIEAELGAAPGPAPESDTGITTTATPKPSVSHAPSSSPSTAPSHAPTPSSIEGAVTAKPTAPAPSSTGSRSAGAPAPSAAGITMVQATLAAMALLAAALMV